MTPLMYWTSRGRRFRRFRVRGCRPGRRAGGEQGFCRRSAKSGAWSWWAAILTLTGRSMPSRRQAHLGQGRRSPIRRISMAKSLLSMIGRNRRLGGTRPRPAIASGSAPRRPPGRRACRPWLVVEDEFAGRQGGAQAGELLAVGAHSAVVVGIEENEAIAPVCLATYMAWSALQQAVGTAVPSWGSGRRRCSPKADGAALDAIGREMTWSTRCRATSHSPKSQLRDEQDELIAPGGRRCRRPGSIPAGDWPPRPGGGRRRRGRGCR